MINKHTPNKTSTRATKHNQKQNQLSKADYILFIVGIISTTLIAAFLANSFLKGHTGLLFTEIALYTAIAVAYIQAFRATRTKALLQYTRVMSYAAIVTAILILSFVAYFEATFRW